MNIIEKLSFSFCSKRTKAMIIPFKLDAYGVEIKVSQEVVLSLVVKWHFFKFEFYESFEFEEMEELIPLRPLDTVVGCCTIKNRGLNSHLKFKWRRSGYEMKDWVEHFLTVFHCPGIDELTFETYCDRFDVNSIADSIKGYPIDLLSIEELKETEEMEQMAARQALELFHNTNELHMGSNPFPLSIQKVFSRNYKTIIFVNFPITLEDLLTINSSEIQSPAWTISEQIFNRFLKLWTRGANCRLERLSILAVNWKNKESVLRNINYEINPTNKKIIFQPSNPYSTKKLVKGGYDIKRHDGTVSTITMSGDEVDYRIDMFIWFK